MKTASLHSLRKWFLTEKRSLPWRESPTPYGVWVSEIMLQQTQVQVVIPYFEKWMKQFPTIQALAHAPESAVIKAWEGLGYYSRARNLHQGAQTLVEHFGGELPSTPEELASIKGIGPYTVGAILSFAFHQKAAAVDGNVYRVLARYYGIEDPIDVRSTQKAIQEAAHQLLPDEEPWVISEALIELGAKVCSKKAHCTRCPLNTSCRAFQNNLQETLPRKKKKTQYEKLFRVVPLFFYENHLLIRQAPQGEVMAGLYEFPYFPAPQALSLQELETPLFEHLQMKGTPLCALPKVQHSFTRFRVQLFPYLIQAESFEAPSSFEWVSATDLTTLPFSSGHKKILDHCLHKKVSPFSH